MTNRYIPHSDYGEQYTLRNNVTSHREVDWLTHGSADPGDLLEHVSAGVHDIPRNSVHMLAGTADLTMLRHVSADPDSLLKYASASADDVDRYKGQDPCNYVAAGTGDNHGRSGHKGHVGNLPGYKGHVGNLPGYKGHAGDLPGYNGHAGDLPGYKGHAGDLPGYKGHAGDLPGYKGHAGDLPGSADPGGSLERVSASVHDNPRDSVHILAGKADLTLLRHVSADPDSLLKYASASADDLDRHKGQDPSGYVATGTGDNHGQRGYILPDVNGIPGHKGYTGDLPGYKGRAGDLPGYRGRAGHLPGYKDRAGHLPGYKGRAGDLPGYKGHVDDLPGYKGHVDDLPGYKGHVGGLPGCKAHVDGLPRRGDYSGYQDQVLPHRGDYSGYQDQVLPHRGDHSEYQDQVLPHRGDHSGYQDQVLPHRGDHSGYRDQVLPHRGDHSGYPGQVLPHRGDHSGYQDQVLPHGGDHSGYQGRCCHKGVIILGSMVRCYHTGVIILGTRVKRCHKGMIILITMSRCCYVIILVKNHKVRDLTVIYPPHVMLRWTDLLWIQRHQSGRIMRITGLNSRLMILIQVQTWVIYWGLSNRCVSRWSQLYMYLILRSWLFLGIQCNIGSLLQISRQQLNHRWVITEKDLVTWYNTVQVGLKPTSKIVWLCQKVKVIVEHGSFCINTTDNHTLLSGLISQFWWMDSKSEGEIVQLYQD